jgi:hypothetical protein
MELTSATSQAIGMAGICTEVPHTALEMERITLQVILPMSLDSALEFSLKSVEVNVRWMTDNSTNGNLFRLKSSDTTPPTVECPQDVIFNSPHGYPVSLNRSQLTLAAMYDDVSETEQLALPRATYGVGTHVITLGAQDASGNTATCIFNLVVSTDGGTPAGSSGNTDSSLTVGLVVGLLLLLLLTALVLYRSQRL